MTVLAAVAGLLTVGGIWLAVTSWRPVPVVDRAEGVVARFHGIDRRRLVAVAAGGLLVLVLTRWPIAAVAGGGLRWAISGMSSRKQRREVDKRTEAIALWAEMLRDAIGTARGVEGVLVATAECLQGRLFATRAEARRAIFKWIIWYNTRRLHTTLGGIPPNEWELQHHKHPSGHRGDGQSSVGLAR